MSFELVDDGTLDTVVECEVCGFQARFSDFDSDNRDEFIEWCKKDAEENHECIPIPTRIIRDR